jgi:hypothetical protein
MEEELEETGLVDYFEQMGFSSDEALLLEEKAIPKEFCQQWKKEYPRDQAEEIAGFFVLGPQEGPAWREALFELEEAQAWHKSGLSAEQALYLSGNGIGQDMALAWHELFPESNLALLFAAAREIAPNCSFENLAAIFALSHDQEQLQCCLKSGFELPDIKLLAQAGLEGVEMASWRSEIPDCSADLIMTFKELGPSEAAGWIHIFPTADFEDILRLVGYGPKPYDIKSLASGSDIKSLLAILAEAGAEGREAGAEGRWVSLDIFRWYNAFPDLPFSEAKEFMEASHCTHSRFVIEWRQNFPFDSAARIAEFMQAGEGDENLAFELRRSDLEPGPGMNFVKECSFKDSLHALTWHEDFPDDSPSYMREYVSCFEGDEQLAYEWRSSGLDFQDILLLVGYGLTMYLRSNIKILQSLPDIGSFLAILAEAGAQGEESDDILQWYSAFPDLPFSEAKEFMEASHCSSTASVIEWRQKFPFDSAARIAELMHACEYDESKAFDRRVSDESKAFDRRVSEGSLSSGA